MKDLLNQLTDMAQWRIEFLIKTSAICKLSGLDNLAKKYAKDVERYVKIKNYLLTRLKKY
jgi:hypothetical protein